MTISRYIVVIHAATKCGLGGGCVLPPQWNSPNSPHIECLNSMETFSRVKKHCFSLCCSPLLVSCNASANIHSFLLSSPQHPLRQCFLLAFLSITQPKETLVTMHDAHILWGAIVWTEACFLCVFCLADTLSFSSHPPQSFIDLSGGLKHFNCISIFSLQRPSRQISQGACNFSTGAFFGGSLQDGTTEILLC